ncbi:MAG: hypothetical protein JOZ69_05890 [Myxococcales bacterium]|nr:hypothetical protein [Myxococcales bacterium]
MSITEGGGGAGFDDLGFARNLGKILAPAGASGTLALVDPLTKEVTRITDLSATRAYQGGHGEGTTSAEEGRGLLFAADRTARKVYVIDASSRTVLAAAPLADGPDYVRWVDATSEIWVTEPHAESIEVFTLPPPGQKPVPARSRTIRVGGGPESLVVDSGRRRAYTHLWGGSTVAIDVGAHKIVGTWPNGCHGSRGIALDEARGFLFAACAEGALSVLDVDQGGKTLGSVRSGAGVDIIAYSSSREHVYLPGAESATMAIVGVSAEGRPSVLATVPTVAGAHCVAADDRGQAWVCDPEHGRLLVFRDAEPGAH